MHFFSPVHKMPLLEVIVTAADRRLGHRHRRRVRAPAGQARDRGARRPRLLHHARARALPERGGAPVEEGAAIEDVDRAMTDFGFPVGPDHAARRGRHRRGRQGARRSCTTPSASAWRRPRSMAQRGRGRPARAARTSAASTSTTDGKKKGVDAHRLRAAARRRRRARARGAARDPGAPRLRVPQRGRALPAGGRSCARRATATSARSSASASRPSWAGRSATSTTWARASRWRCWSGCARKHGDAFPAGGPARRAWRTTDKYVLHRMNFFTDNETSSSTSGRAWPGTASCRSGKRASASRTARARWARRASSTTRRLREVGRIRGARDRAAGARDRRAGRRLRGRPGHPPARPAAQHRRPAASWA